MAAKGARVHIYGDWDGTGVKRAQQDLSTFGKQAQGFSSTFTRSFAGIGAAVGGAFAVSKVADFFQASARAALEDQAAVAKLGKTLDNLGMSYAATNVESFIAKLEAQTGVLDDHLRPAFDRLIRSTQNVGEAQSSMQLALDISASKGVAVGDVAKALGRAYDGNAGALGRLGLGLDKAVLKSGDMHKITGMLSSLYAGQAQTAAETYQGKLNRVSVAAQNAQETIGYALLGAVDDLANGMGGTGGVVDAINSSSKSLANFITGLGKAAFGVESFISAANGMVQQQTGVSDFFSNMMKWSYAVLPPLAAAAAAYQGVAGFGENKNPGIGPSLDQINARRGRGVNGIDPALANVIPAIHTNTASAAGSHAKAVDYTAQAYAKLKTAYDDWYKGGFDGLKAKLDEATSAFSDFKTSVRDSIAGALDFGSAAQEVDESGAKVGKSFIEKLQEQAALAVGFADKVKTLIASGLSRESLSQVIAAGATAGSSIADELIAGGTTAIDTTNSLVTSAQGAADEVGTLSAEKWYGAGVKSAQATVDAFAAEYGPKGKSRAAIMEHMDKLAESMNRNATVTVTTINRVVSQSVPSVARGGIDNDVLTPFALGGVVTGPTRALIGEKGPEAVIPLDRMGQMGGTTINVYVEGSVSSERDLIASIRDGIAQDVRRRGGDPSFLGV